MANCACATSAPGDGFLKVYEEASANNSQIAVSRHEFSATKELLPQARATLLPSLSAESVFSQTSTSGVQQSTDTQRAGAVYKVYLTQPLFRADRWYGYTGAQKKLDQALLKLLADEQDLIMKAAEHYVAVLQAHDDLSSQNHPRVPRVNSTVC
ncbi:TolC family protein [Azorhizophilus paspali]|uniref:TolC family protein n=1 Tax=Azorhizophilus paspali TaxID=69963 RepID=A0ABV6SKU2_AZOPA